MKSMKKWIPYAELLFLVLLAIYPFRHVHLGVDLMDAGYNYTNFKYNDPESIGSMWFFATWSANMFGNFVMKFPFAQNLLGVNIYTTSIISLMAVSSYWFFTRKIHVPKVLTFAGEMLAISLCWLPSGVLYTYLTYALFLAGNLFLYIALTEEKKKYLIIAGICLGLNVTVRFSNLSQMGMILAVWGYALINKKKVVDVLKETGLCILGYVTTLVVFFAIMCLVYGAGNYLNGITSLFDMTQYSKDYEMSFMLWGMISGYFQIGYWVKRWMLFGVGVILVCLALPKRFRLIKQIFTIVLIVTILLWFKKSGFILLDYSYYFSVYYPCVLLFLMAFVMVFLLLLNPTVDKDKKLQAMLLVLNMFLSALGSNNALFATMNNLFFIVPCILSLLLVFIQNKNHRLLQPFRIMILTSLVLLAVQGYMFGANFVYEEAAGARDVSTRVEGVPVLKGMYTGSKRAEQLEELYQYFQKDQFVDKKCILIGDIPGLAYYMELTPAMNTWCDLRSYSLENMQKDMNVVESAIRENGEYPFIVLHQKYKEYFIFKDEEALEQAHTIKEKLDMLVTFAEKYKYSVQFENDLVVVLAP